MADMPWQQHQAMEPMQELLHTVHMEVDMPWQPHQAMELMEQHLMGMLSHKSQQTWSCLQQQHMRNLNTVTLNSNMLTSSNDLFD
jgi:hypothetical protein